MVSAAGRRGQGTAGPRAGLGERGAQPVSGPRTIAAAALARKLLVALWRYLATGLVPDGAGLKG